MEKEDFFVEKIVEKMWISGRKNFQTLPFHKKKVSNLQKKKNENIYTQNYKQCG